MHGPIPKNRKLLQRRNKEGSAQIFIDKHPLKKMPELPKRRRKWRPETLAWWEDIWSSPMASEFIKVDIHGLYILADLIDCYWREHNATLATEIRLQRQCYGMTPIDRRRLQWNIERAEKANERGRKRREKGKKSKNYEIDPRDILEGIN